MVRPAALRLSQAAFATTSQMFRIAPQRVVISGRAVKRISPAPAQPIAIYNHPSAFSLKAVGLVRAEHRGYVRTGPGMIFGSSTPCRLSLPSAAGRGQNRSAHIADHDYG